MFTFKIDLQYDYCSLLKVDRQTDCHLKVSKKTVTYYLVRIERKTTGFSPKCAREIYR